MFFTTQQPGFQRNVYKNCERAEFCTCELSIQTSVNFKRCKLSEWVFSNRALWFARGNPGPLPGMDQDDFARASVYDGVALAILAEQFQAIRAAGLAQYRTFSEQILGRRGIASGGEVSVRALLYILAGHLRHHLRVLEDRYLVT